MPEDDVFFIANVKIEDMGIYSCMAQNIAGGLSANATLTVLGKCCAGLCLPVALGLSREERAEMMKNEVRAQIAALDAGFDQWSFGS